MRLEPLYRLTFEYPEGWPLELEGFEQHFYVAEGRWEPLDGEPALPSG